MPGSQKAPLTSSSNLRESNASTSSKKLGSRKSDASTRTTRKPSGSRFKQQKLNAWQPSLTAGTVLLTFFVIGLVYVPIGAILLVSSNQVQEYVFDYTDDCNATINNRNVACKDAIKNQTPCRCAIRFNVKEKIDKPVYIYYGLTNFYQNHRRYVISRDDDQLLGDYSRASQDCQPFVEDENGTVFYPCGAVANSMFNDTFRLSREMGSNSQDVSLLFTNLAWSSDKDKKYFNPKDSWKDVEKSVVKPTYWTKPIWKLNENDSNENGVKNEAFIVWMRTAALPTFRKLHSRVNHKEGSEYAGSLPAGNYTISIEYNYPVDSFDGRKRFIISNTSWAGGKNPFLGVAYIVVGSLCILTGFIFLLIHMKFGKSLTEMASVNY